MTFGDIRKAYGAPVVPLGIIPGRQGGETRSAALVDVRLCASLVIVVVLVLVGFFLLRVYPGLMQEPGLWPLVPPGLWALVRLSRGSFIRVVRFRRG
ncbi:hypothetical protein [Streptomyces antimicrobicus]|uniref:Uncharacterized protein n=1 Tax=Streptomyces antimicrobicus TaxID=2883108 RepID=A0ABS8BEU9_9ACTN|nr:hypothetical protein [Streptomyces antimicrobicus]MCB5183048.1 hypothetical protein [Streptomyces antimicrobicus]